MVVATLAPCFSLAMLMTSFVLRDISLPPTWGMDVVIGNISHIMCSEIDVGALSVSYNDTGISVQGLQTTTIQCQANFNETGDPSVLSIVLDLPPVNIEVAMERGPTNESRCEVFWANMTSCSVAPRLLNLSLAPAAPNNVNNWILSQVETFVNEYLPSALCGLVNSSLVPALLNHTDAAPAVSPSISPGLTDLRDSQLIGMLLNIIHGLPTLFGFLEVSATVVAPTALEVNVSIGETLDVDVPLGAGFLKTVVPGGTVLSLQLWFKDFVCNGPFMCTIARNSGVQVANVRLSGAGELDRVVDNVAGPLVAALLNDILAMIVNSTASHTDNNGYEYTAINLSEAETTNQPPFALAVGLAALFAASAVAVIGYSAYRHSKHPVLGPDGEPIPLKRVMVEDSFVVITSFCTMYLFAWSNSTKAAEVRMGEAYVMYTFSLSSTIQDLYSAGLYALCVFIFLFCGFYPYFKLLSIVLFSVILQRPQSKVLMFIDSCGKLSLLDTFMMVIMVTGLEVKGIATVRMLSGFYLFLVATLLSILVGNYATHGWRREGRSAGTPLRVKQSLEQLQLSPRPSDFKDANEVSSDDGVPQSRRPWNKAVAIPAAVIIITGSVIGMTQIILQYNLSGIATVVTGTRREFSLLDLLKATPWPIYGSSLLTVIIAPMLYSVGYPKSHVLGAWCATDALLLACVGGLLQLSQFVRFVMGPALSTVYQAEAELRPALGALFASMLVQWILVGSEVCQVDPIDVLKSWMHRICCRAESSKTSQHDVIDSSSSLCTQQQQSSYTVDLNKAEKLVD